MYVCMYICTSMHVYMHACMCVFMYVRMDACTYVCMFVCIMCVYPSICICAVSKSDDMHEYFKTSLLPRLRAGATGDVNAEPHTLIFVPSYFDFVRLRNTMLRDDVDFMQCSE